MTKFYLDFDASTIIEAKTEEEAKEIFQSNLPPEIFAVNVFGIEKDEIEEESEEYCDWTFNRGFKFAASNCGSLDTHRIDFLKMKYCPYCGKAIKIS